MQQRLGSDVEVQQGGRAAQFRQTEPSPNEAGLVREEQGHRVPFLQPGFSLQGSGHLVAPFVHFAIRVRATFKVHEDLIGVPFHCIQEAVQDAVKWFEFLVNGQPGAEFNVR